MSASARFTTVSTYIALASAAAIAFLLPDGLPAVGAAAGSASALSLTGIVRDFSSSHPDFAVSGGYGHRAGNIAERLDVRGLPMFKGGQPITDFSITDGAVLPGEDFAAEIRLLGAEVKKGPKPLPVTMQVSFGGDYFVPFGPFHDAIAGNVSTDQSITGDANPGTNPRRHVIATRYDAGTPITATGRSWVEIGGSWVVEREVASDVDSAQVRVLRKGDAVPTLNGAYDPGNVAPFMADYVSTDGTTIVLGDNQALFLFELEVTGGDATADFQDLVVLVSLATSAGYFDPHARYGEGYGSEPGFEVVSQWTDAGGNPIAPHLCLAGLATPSGVIQVVSGLGVGSNATLDTYDSTDGPYGGANVGPAPSVQSIDAIPAIAIPEVTPFQASYVLAAAPGDLFDDLYCDTFFLDGTAILTVHGSRTIVVDTSFALDNFAEIILAPGASLDVFVRGSFHLDNSSKINVNTADPSLVRVFIASSDGFLSIENHAVFFGSIIAPDTQLDLKNHAEVFGRTLTERLEIINHGALHFDTELGAPVTTTCGTIFADVSGTAGAASTGGITSSATFDQWFSDHPGVNLSTNHTIVLEPDGAGVWEFTTDAFHPIDDRLLLNEGDAHNRNLTYAIQAEFQYEACVGQFFEFEGTDDTWVFVAGRLVIDLGGMQPGTRQRIDMERLHLVDGEVYQLHFYHAQRGPRAEFSVRTNIPLSTPLGNAVVTGGFD